jgi:EmrB/QacA subfamily drug resistance transporter
MPSVVADLRGLALYPWVFSAYLLTATVVTPVCGRLADARGRKSLYLIGLGLFLAGSALSGAAPSMGFLVAMRALQGLGAGALIPVTLTLVGDLYPLEERARMQGVFASVWGIASVVGPPVGGALVEHAGWRWVFYLNIPFGLAAGWLIHRHLREPRGRRRAHELDVAGALALVLGLTALLYALQAPGRGRGLLEPDAVGACCLGGILLAAFVVRERRAEEPLVDPALFKDRIFLAANAGGFLAFGALYSATAYVPLLVRGVRGGSAQAAGLALMPLSLAWVAGSIVAGRLLLRAGYRLTVGLGVVCIVGGCGGLAAVSRDSAGLHLLGTLGVLGAGMGLAMTGFIVAVQAAAPSGRMGIATSSVHFFRSLGGAVGVALLGAVLLGALRGQGIDPSRVSPLAGVGLAPVAPDALMSALHPVFLTSLAFALGTLAAGFAMPGGSAHQHVHPSRR